MLMFLILRNIWLFIPWLLGISKTPSSKKSLLFPWSVCKVRLWMRCLSPEQGQDLVFSPPTKATLPAPPYTVSLPLKNPLSFSSNSMGKWKCFLYSNFGHKEETDRLLKIREKKTPTHPPTIATYQESLLFWKPSFLRNGSFSLCCVIMSPSGSANSSTIACVLSACWGQGSKERLSTESVWWGDWCFLLPF